MHNRGLRVLDLSLNASVGNSGARALGRMLEGNMRLIQLLLVGAGVGDEGVQSLCVGLLTNKTLRAEAVKGGGNGGQEQISVGWTLTRPA